MTYKIIITQTAEIDLNGAADYIEFTLLNPQAANDLLDKVEEAIGSLSDNPQIHKLVDDPVLKAWGIRYVLVDNYMAFFKIDEDRKTVYFVRFL